MEFHISKSIRKTLDLDDLLFSYSGNVVFANVAACRKLAQRLNDLDVVKASPDKAVNAGALFAMGLIDELSHALVERYRKETDPTVMAAAVGWLGEQVKPEESERLLLAFVEQFPTVDVYRGKVTPKKWLEGKTEGRPNREIAFEEMMLLWVANSNPAFSPFHMLFDDAELKKQTTYSGVTKNLPKFFATRPQVGKLAVCWMRCARRCWPHLIR